MAAKLVVLLALAAVAHSFEHGIHDHSYDHAAAVEPLREEVRSFSYNVADPYTGDFKSQSETRVGGAVQGQYSLLDADGTRRTVDYAADDLNGFNAVVRKDAVGVAAPVVAARVVAPTVARTVAAPIVAAPNVLTGGAVLANHPFAASSVYADSAPLVSRTVLNGVGGARTFAAPHFGAARFYDARTLNTGVLSRTFAAPTVLSSGARLVDSRTFAAPAVYNAGFAAPLVTRTFAAPGVYAASAPLRYAAGHDLLATRTFAPHDVTGGLVGGRLVSPLNTFSGRLVTGHGIVRSDW